MPIDTSSPPTSADAIPTTIPDRTDDDLLTMTHLHQLTW
jgi:hypothetical protein